MDMRQFNQGESSVELQILSAVYRFKFRQVVYSLRLIEQAKNSV